MGQKVRFLPISIHAPLTGSDSPKGLTKTVLRNFNPRSPYGERRSFRCLQFRTVPFQSTLPLRGATLFKRSRDNPGKISIHAPLTGSDRICSPNASNVFISIHAPLTGSDARVGMLDLWHPDFNPRSPYGERRVDKPGSWTELLFQSTLPLRGATMRNRG